VRSLIRRHITSVEQLEALLVVHGSREACTVDDVHRRLKTSPSSIERSLADLESAGLLTSARATAGRAFRYAPSSDDLAGAVDELAALHPTWRAALVACIYQKGP
jgi:predicted transcriptional regulator